jgi:hypothetical protein
VKLEKMFLSPSGDKSRITGLATTWRSSSQLVNPLSKAGRYSNAVAISTIPTPPHRRKRSDFTGLLCFDMPLPWFMARSCAS